MYVCSLYLPFHWNYFIHTNFCFTGRETSGYLAWHSTLRLCLLVVFLLLLLLVFLHNYELNCHPARIRKICEILLLVLFIIINLIQLEYTAFVIFLWPNNHAYSFCKCHIFIIFKALADFLLVFLMFFQQVKLLGIFNSCGDCHLLHL